MRIIFMGSPEFAVSSLNLLLKSGNRPLAKPVCDKKFLEEEKMSTAEYSDVFEEHKRALTTKLPSEIGLCKRSNEIIAVYTKAPKPSGRGQKLTKSPVHVIAEESDIEVCTPISLKSSVEQERFKNFKPDVAVVSAYGLILPREVLNTPKYGCINIHPSLLPRWRGAAPIQHTILAGDQETGVSIMQLDEGLDSGPILKQKKFLVEKNDNYEVLHKKLSKLGSDLLLDVLSRIEKHVPIAQNDDDACYADKVEDYKIYASDTCEVACRKIKAFYPKAFIKIENKRIRILDADFEVNAPLASKQGEIVNDNMHISLRGGILIPKVVQMEGRSSCGIEDFIRGLKSSMAKKIIG